MTTPHVKGDHLVLGGLSARGRTLGIAVLAVGAVLALVFALIGGLGIDELLRGWIVAFCFGLTICLGALFWTLVQHATRAGWSVVVRRVSESVASNLQWYWVLFIPILLAPFVSHIYHWMYPVYQGELDPVLAHKAVYFFGINPVDTSGADPTMTTHIPYFWLLRAVLFLAVWAWIARYFHRTSLLQDRTGDASLTSRMQYWAPLALIAYGLTQSFAAFDWVMSLEAHWFSTMFGVYFFAASCCGFFATYIIIVTLLHRSGKLVKEVSREHFQELGKALFAFGVVFWAYIAFSQFMLIWYANIPEETGWYLARQIKGWQWLGLLLLVGHFAVPFLVLITRHTKRMIPILGLIATYMLVMHVADLMYLVLPIVPHSALATATSIGELVASIEAADVGLNASVLLYAISLAAAIAGALCIGTTRALGQGALLPVNDPRLPESLAFENM